MTEETTFHRIPEGVMKFHSRQLVQGVGGSWMIMNRWKDSAGNLWGTHHYVEEPVLIYDNAPAQCEEVEQWPTPINKQ